MKRHNLTLKINLRKDCFIHKIALKFLQLQKKIVEMIATHYQPYSIVEDRGFKFNANYRTQISNSFKKIFLHTGNPSA